MSTLINTTIYIDVNNQEVNILSDTNGDIVSPDVSMTKVSLLINDQVQDIDIATTYTIDPYVPTVFLDLELVNEEFGTVVITSLIELHTGVCNTTFTCHNPVVKGIGYTINTDIVKYVEL